MSSSDAGPAERSANGTTDRLLAQNGAHPTAPGFAGLGLRTGSPMRRPTARQARKLGLVALVLVMLGGTVGYLSSLLVTPQYAARSDVLYLVTREQPTGFLREDRNLTTQVVLISSRAVIDPVATSAGIPIDELTQKITATVVPESEVIKVELRDPDPARATRLLDAVVARYIEVSNNDKRSAVQNYLDTELRDVLRRINQLPVGDAEERAPLVEREQDLRSKLDELNVADLAGPAASVLAQAYPQSDPVYPNRTFAAGTGTLSGLLVALIVVAVLARRMTR